jgi:hypothetical protein
MEDLLDGYTTPDGVRVDTNYIGPPADSMASALEWTGEWTVTYETFRDMGLAFGAALILIYILVVWEFGNFTLPAIVMAPIPLTLIGIVPGHWLFGASFTATSMIGFIALAGIIVRNSILLVDFSLHAVRRGMNVQDAVINACQTRTRPILITAAALVAGSSVILSDPIFQGMAISLMFGGMVSTLLTLVVIPLGCVSFRKALLNSAGEDDTGDTPTGSGNPEAALARARAERRAGGGLIGGLGAVLRGIVDLVVLAVDLVLLGLRKLFAALTPRRDVPAMATAAATAAPVATPPVAAPAAPPPVAAPAAPPAPVENPVEPAVDTPAKAPAKARKPAPKAAAKPAPAGTPDVKPAPKTPAKPANPTEAAKPAPRPAAGRRGIRLKRQDGGNDG